MKHSNNLYGCSICHVAFELPDYLAKHVEECITNSKLEWVSDSNQGNSSSEPKNAAILLRNKSTQMLITNCEKEKSRKSK